MALIAASAALLTNNHHANYHREPNVHREGCTSGKNRRHSYRTVEKR